MTFISLPPVDPTAMAETIQTLDATDIKAKRPLTRVRTLTDDEARVVVDDARTHTIDSETVVDSTGDTVELTDALLSTVLFRGDITHAKQCPVDTGTITVHVELPVTFEQFGEGFVTARINADCQGNIERIAVEAYAG
jgi:hypothetical protein